MEVEVVFGGAFFDFGSGVAGAAGFLGDVAFEEELVDVFWGVEEA